MLNNISEGAMRAATKIDPSATIHDKETAQKRAEQVRHARPVENTEAGGQTNAKDTQNDKSSKYLLDDNTLVFEKYNKDGDLVLRIPPSYKPINERI